MILAVNCNHCYWIKIVQNEKTSGAVFKVMHYIVDADVCV